MASSLGCHDGKIQAVDRLNLACCFLQAQPVSAERDLAQEACYRAIGEGFMHVAEHFSFSNWYQQELRFLLQAPASRVGSASNLVLL